MSSVETVEDPEDPRLADYREIRDAERRRLSGTFIAEGRTVVLRLLSARPLSRSIRAAHPACSPGPGGDAGGAGVPIYLVRQDIVKAIVGIEFHHGCLAVGERGMEPTAEAVLAEAHADRIVVLEGLGDASNVGAIFRNALAFGAGAALLSPGTADPLYRKAIRVSSGAAVVLPFAWLPGWPDLGLLRAAGYTVIALTPRDDALAIEELGRSRPFPARAALPPRHRGPRAQRGRAEGGRPPRPHSHGS